MSTTQQSAANDFTHLGATTAIAVSYLRVSTKEQAERGGRDEGFSIPAQREANLRKARDLGAIVVEEFVDAGESARKADRPELMRMIEYVKTNHVAYCIVHKVDRLARNRADDVAIHVALKDAGVMLVSATENIDETPSGMLLHGIMSTIAEFYSRNLANEVSKGMSQKAMTGGTNGKAPIGYLNVTTRDELGRELRIVEPDPTRAEIVKWAFEAYATGNYSTAMLREALIDRGLTTPPTPKRPARPPALSTVQKMLSNPYYKGSVSFRGATYDGIHEPLVGPEVWYRVQAVLGAKQVSGEKPKPTITTSKAPCSAVSAAPDSWSPTPGAAVASSTRISSVPVVTPNAPTVNAKQCMCLMLKPRSKTTLDFSPTGYFSRSRLPRPRVLGLQMGAPLGSEAKFLAHGGC